jgi:cytochrome P450
MPTFFWYLAYILLTLQYDDFIKEIASFSSSSSSRTSIPRVSDVDFTKLLSSPLLNSGLKETLRIQNHGLSPRNLDEDTYIKIMGKEYLLKKGTFSFAPSTLVNRKPEIFEEPEEWKADRFIEKDARDVYLDDGHPAKSDVKKLKTLMIWGGGAHKVKQLEFWSSHAVSWTSFCYQ